MTTEFWITAVVLTLSPGPGVLFTVAAALSRGVRQGIVAALGCTLGLLPHAAAAVSGAALLLAASPTAFAVLTWAGVGYLLLMAWSTLRHGLDLGTDAPPPRTVARTVVSAVLLNRLNPKLTVFFLVFLPQFVPAGTDHAVGRMALLSGGFMLVTLVLFVGYAVVAAGARGAVVGRPRLRAWVRRALSLSFVALGARLALQAR